MAKRRAKKFFKRKDPIIIEPYGGFANENEFFTVARVLEDEGIRSSQKDGTLKNLWNTYKRMESDEIPYAEVEVSWEDQSVVVKADDEGYVHYEGLHTKYAQGAKTKWLELHFRLIDPDNGYTTTTQLLSPGTDADFGVITDMDDTVIHTGVASLLKWRLIFNSMLVHAKRRKPLEGAQEWYALLHKGKGGEQQNPFFYVSNSPWNLHQYLSQFLAHNDFPKGPLILRDVGFKKKPKSLQEGDKYKSIQKILEAFPKKPFVLIGDSAEFDTEIYLDLARNYSDQIKAIFIRTVKSKKRVQRVKKIIESTQDVYIRLISSADEAIVASKELELF